LSRRVDQFMERTEEGMEQAEARMTQLDSISTPVLERMDRFIQGREGNGHREPRL
jgi:hypothetical protein